MSATSCTLMLILLCGVIGVGRAAITLKHIKTEYLPYSYDPQQYGLKKADSEKGALDKNNNIIYAVGKSIIYVINFKDLSAISHESHVIMPDDVEANDVSTCGTWVAVAASNNVDSRQGSVYIYNTYTSGGSMALLDKIIVGTIPDMLLFTRDCKKLVVAIEGSVSKDTDGLSYDPEGEVVIITFRTDPSGAYDVTRADFTAFNSRAREYVSRGVRWVYRGENATFSTSFSQDLEPEYIAFNQLQTVAYVILQENNAVATLDLATGKFTEIYSFGEKWWLSSGLDASDKDNETLTRPWDIYGLYQPDGVQMTTYNGQQYLITANEGDEKEYRGSITWAESQRGKQFFENDEIADTVASTLKESLKDDTQLGRLSFSKVDYTSVTGKYSKFVTYGGRSISLFKVEPSGNISLHWDSGSELEDEVIKQHANIFNGGDSRLDRIDTASRDSRSDNKGPEPEAIELGELDGTALIFVGLERPGMVAVYSVDPGTAQPQFESLRYSCSTGDTWGNMYDSRTCWDLDPESLIFIPGERSPSREPLLAVVGSISGTVSFYTVTRHQDPVGDNPKEKSLTVLSPGAIAGVVCACCALIACIAAIVQCAKTRSKHNTPLADQV